MSFKILQGDSSRIFTDITPLHPGWCYFTSDDGKLYIDSEEADGTQKRTCINANGGSESVAVKATLTKNGWVNGRQTLLVTGLKAKHNGIISIAQEATDFQIEAAKGAEMYVCSQADGALTIAVFGGVPQIDIPVVTILMA